MQKARIKSSEPDEQGHWGKFGGRYVPETLVAPLEALTAEFMQPLVRNWEQLAVEFLQPMLHVPQHPITLMRFGIPAICPATLLTKLLFKDESARALFAGIAAHSFLPLEAPASTAFALVLGLAGHARFGFVDIRCIPILSR